MIGNLSAIIHNFPNPNIKNVYIDTAYSIFKDKFTILLTSQKYNRLWLIGRVPADFTDEQVIKYINVKPRWKICNRDKIVRE